MRPSVVISTLLLAVAIFGLVYLTSRTAHHVAANSGETPASAPVAQAETSQTTVPSPAPVYAPPPQPVVNGEVPATIPAPMAEVQTNHEEYVHDRAAQLMALAMNDDSDSLNTIWTEMSNPDKDIRAAALAALVQFGDSSVTPRLRELAGQTQDPQEKLEILSAADQLDLPPISSLQGKRQTNGPQ
jgi:hypothetical protein